MDAHHSPPGLLNCHGKVTYLDYAVSFHKHKCRLSKFNLPASCLCTSKNALIGWHNIPVKSNAGPFVIPIVQITTNANKTFVIIYEKLQKKCETSFYIIFFPLETHSIIESILRCYILSLKSYSSDLYDCEIMALRDSLWNLYSTCYFMLQK